MGLDSVELVMEVEKHFSISIPDREAEKAYSVGKLVDCVANILGVKSYDFSLREKTFSSLKNELRNLKKGINDFSINSKVAHSLDIQDKLLVLELENKTSLKLPLINFKAQSHNGIWRKVRTWLTAIDEINFEEIAWKKFIDIIIADNLKE